MTQIALQKTRFPFVSTATHGWLIVTMNNLFDVGLKESDFAPSSKINPEGDLIALDEDKGAQRLEVAGKI